MKKDKNFALMAAGLLLVAGSGKVDRFITSINDFTHGCILGVGLGIMPVALYRMKFKTPSHQVN